MNNKIDLKTKKISLFIAYQLISLKYYKKKKTKKFLDFGLFHKIS